VYELIKKADEPLYIQEIIKLLKSEYNLDRTKQQVRSSLNNYDSKLPEFHANFIH